MQQSGAPPPPDPLAVLRGSDAEVAALSFNPTAADVLLSGSASGTLDLWDVETRRPSATVARAHRDAGVLHVAWLGAEQALSQGRDCQLRRWRLRDGAALEADGRIVYDSINFCRAAVRGSMVAVPGDNGEIVVKDLESGSTVHTCATGMVAAQEPGDAWSGMCMAVEFVEHARIDGGRPALLSLYEDGHMYLWSVTAGRVLATSRPAGAAARKEPGLCLAVTRASERALHCVTGFASPEIQQFALGLGGDAPVFEQRGAIKLNHEGIADIAVRSDAKIFATAGWDKRVRVFRTKTGAPLAILKSHVAGVQAVAFAPTSHLLASGGKDRRIALWDVFRRS